MAKYFMFWRKINCHSASNVLVNKATKDMTNGRWKLQNVDLVSRVTCMKYKKCVMKKKKILLLIGLLVTLKDKVSAF